MAGAASKTVLMKQRRSNKKHKEGTLKTHKKSELLRIRFLRSMLLKSSQKQRPLSAPELKHLPQELLESRVIGLEELFRCFL